MYVFIALRASCELLRPTGAVIDSGVDREGDDACGTQTGDARRRRGVVDTIDHRPFVSWPHLTIIYTHTKIL